MFIADDAQYATAVDKNRRLSNILRTTLRDKNIKTITRIDEGSRGWQFEFI